MQARHSSLDDNPDEPQMIVSSRTLFLLKKFELNGNMLWLLTHEDVSDLPDADAVVYVAEEIRRGLHSHTDAVIYVVETEQTDATKCMETLLNSLTHSLTHSLTFGFSRLCFVCSRMATFGLGDS